MKDYLKKLKAWEKVVQEQRDRSQEEQEKIDLREDGQSEGMDINGDGLVNGDDVHYSPDKKQNSERKEKEYHRSFRK